MANQVMERGARVEREKAFYDAHSVRYERSRRWISRALAGSRRTGELSEYFDPRGKVVLDYGCGSGTKAISYLDMGADRVIGIDVSERRIQEARARANAAKAGDRLQFLVTDAHHTGFPDSSFDLIVGKSVLHHLDLEAALTELRRLLRPGGTAVFVEPLWHNPFLRLGRALTPNARTRDEHPLTVADWKLCASIFPRFRHYERELITIPLLPLNLVMPLRWQKRLARRLAAVDDLVLARFPALRRHARISFLVLAT